MELINKKILITAPVHQTEEIFIEYLNSIHNLIIPNGYECNLFFYLHNCPELKKYLKDDEYTEILDNSKYEIFSHKFKKDNYSALSYMRTAALQKAREENYDYVFSVDSDVILHKDNLKELLQDEKDIVAKMYWTIFDSNLPYYAMPNCYDYIDYEGRRIFKRGINSLKFLGIYEMGVVGACTLILFFLFFDLEFELVFIVLYLISSLIFSVSF